jgi:hypothetical protein
MKDEFVKKVSTLSKKELTKKIAAAKRQVDDPELAKFRAGMLDLITVYERRLEELNKLENDVVLWYASPKDKLKYSTLIYRVKRKIEEVVKNEFVKLMRDAGLNRRGSIAALCQRYFMMPSDNKSMPSSDKAIAGVIFESGGYGIWQTSLYERIEKKYPELQETTIPYEFLFELSDDFLLNGLGENGDETLRKLLHSRKWYKQS